MNKTTRCLIIFEDGTTKYDDYDFSSTSTLDKYFKGYTAGIVLHGTSYLENKLSMFVDDVHDYNKPINKYASKIASYLKSEYIINPITIYGNALLVDDNKNINDNFLKQIDSYIQAKKNKQMPSKLKRINQRLEKDIRSCKIGMLKNILQQSFNDSKRFGIATEQMPDWL